MKFGNLLKKELGELMTFQTIFGMVFTFVLLVLMGQFMGNAIEDSIDTSAITICDQDKTEFSASVIDVVKSDETLKVTMVDLNSDDYASELTRLDVTNLVIIPEGFSDTITVQKKPAQLIIVNRLATGGVFSSLKSLSSADAADKFSNIITDSILKTDYGIPSNKIDDIKNPIDLNEYTVVGDNCSNISSSVLSGVTMAQSMIVPFAIFFLILMASQMIMTAISTEKIDKTLETLLSTPVSRISVLTAKMTAALIIALINAVVTMLGFGVYVLSMTKGMTSDMTGIGESAANTGVNVATAMSELNMTLSPVNILSIGISIFVSIAIGLALALILGAMATDVKSVQTLIMPLMILTLIPFIATIYADLSTMSAGVKAILYIIPFTHSYTAYNNLTTGNDALFWFGLLYEVVFLIVVMFLAVKLFTSDRLFTMKFDFSKKSKKGAIKED